MSVSRKVTYNPKLAGAMMSLCQTCENDDKRPGAFACLLPQRGERHTRENCPKLRLATPTLYTEQQIKAAFWRAFHECSVLYFDSMTGKHGNEESTRGHWVKLLAELEKELDE